MVHNDIFNTNKINFVGFFISKKDRDLLPPEYIRGTLTENILAAKSGQTSRIGDLASLLAKHIEKRRLVLVPFPSTDKAKPKKAQLPFLLVNCLTKEYPMWTNGSGFLSRAYSLPKNTRDAGKQFESLVCRTAKLAGMDIVIIDDVVTSGSSMKAALKIMSRTGAKSVRCLALARKMRLKDIPLTAKY